jgi:hypothetical protein
MEVTPQIKIRMAAALNEALPDDVAAAATPDGLRVIVGDREGPPIIGGVEVSAWDWNGNLDVEVFALRILDEIQEAYIESIALTGWPPADPRNPMAPQTASELPAPNAEVVGDELRWWYGDRDGPALELPAVRLDSG